MFTRLRWFHWAAVALLSLGALGWAAFGRSESETVFTVEKARRDTLRESVQATGEIQARTRVNVGTSVTAEIKAIHVKDGQWVQAGELLVTLDQERFRQQLNQSELGLRMSRQELQNAELAFAKQEQTWKRQEALFRQQLVSAEEHQTAKLARDTAETTLQRARVAVQQAQAQVALAQDALDKTMIRASMPGRVTGLKAEKGETALAGQTGLAGATLMIISDLSEMLAEVKVGELDVVKLKPGQPAEVQVDAFPGKVFQGKVLEVATSVDRSAAASMSQDAQNYKVRIQLQGGTEELAVLRPGMSARVAVLSQEVKDVLTVPLQAIQERESRSGGLGLMSGTRPVVFVVKDGKAEERSLRQGAATRRAIQVLEGIQEGEEVITGPSKALTSLPNGAKVRVQTEAEAMKGRKK